MSDHERHITSLVVHAHPERIEDVMEAVNAMAGAEVHDIAAGGKFVVTLETDTLYEVTDAANEIGRLNGVVNAVLVYHQIEQAERLDDTVDISAATLAPDQSFEVTP